MHTNLNICQSRLPAQYNSLLQSYYDSYNCGHECVEDTKQCWYTCNTYAGFQGNMLEQPPRDNVLLLLKEN